MTKRSSALHRLVGDERGNVAILFALVSLPLLGFTGAAIDYGFATRLQVKLQAATDATALALCQTPLATSTADLQKQASAAMTGYMGETVTVDALAISNNPRQIALTTHATSTPFFGKFTGTSSLIALGTTARCATPLPRTFEIALVLDNTGSMKEQAGEQTKMEALKTAATNFVDYVDQNDAFSKETRLSVVPFASSVAIPARFHNASWVDTTGKVSYHWQNVIYGNNEKKLTRLELFSRLKTVKPEWGWAGCLETPPYPLNVGDNTPTPSNNDSYFVPMFAPDEPGDGSAGVTTVLNSRSINSYISDTNCKSNDNTTFMERLGRACKYNAPTGAVSTQSNALGLPNGPNYGCTTQQLLTLTGDKTALKSAISAMNPLGSTNTHEGIMWGWRTISPNSVLASDSKPAAYNSTAVNKIMIVMSDGENMWPTHTVNPTRAWYTPAGYIRNVDDAKPNPNPRLPPGNQNISNASNARNALDALTKESCQNLQSTGIEVFTIGFSTPDDPIDDQGKQLLQGCASGGDHYIEANDAKGLIEAFDRIAKSIGKLRLTQ